MEVALAYLQQMEAPGLAQQNGAFGTSPEIYDGYHNDFDNYKIYHFLKNKREKRGINMSRIQIRCELCNEMHDLERLRFINKKRNESTKLQIEYVKFVPVCYICLDKLKEFVCDQCINKPHSCACLLPESAKNNFSQTEQGKSACRDAKNLFKVEPISV